jgi:DNA invertase Pin-like site-specific DNA recombinase
MTPIGSASDREWSKQRDWIIVAEYVDTGVSATDDNRPEFRRIVDDAVRPQPGFELTGVRSYSRYFRDNALGHHWLRGPAPI